jgi:hypothetical protein
MTSTEVLQSQPSAGKEAVPDDLHHDARGGEARNMYRLRRCPGGEARPVPAALNDNVATPLNDTGVTLPGGGFLKPTGPREPRPSYACW